MGFTITPLRTTWDYKTVQTKLQDLAKPFERNSRYVKADLSIGDSGIGYRIAKTVRLNNLIFNINLAKSKEILVELHSQIEKTNDNNLINLYKKAVFNFNLTAPRHVILPFQIESTMSDRVYLSVKERHYPPILKRDPSFYYPTKFFTIYDGFKRDDKGNLKAELLVKRDQIALKYGYSEIKDFKSFEKIFNEYILDHYNDLNLSEGAWDLHDIHFQNLALRLTESMSDKEVRNPKTKALAHLSRARNFAIGARETVGWDGRPLVTEAQRKIKQKEMETHWRSIVLRDWGGIKVEHSDWTAGIRSQKITVVAEDTQTAVERLAKHYSSNKICWVNMANAHQTGGGYQSLGKAQEEVVTTNSDAIVVLSNLGELNFQGNIFIQGSVFYRKHLHIPPGGNYFHQTRFITGEPITCNSIVHAFADFRVGDVTERQDFVDASDKLAVNTQEYRDRIKLDMRGVLLTAIAEKQEVVILGATGCDVFGHDPMVESQAWKEVLNEPAFKNQFSEVVFAILPDPKHPNNISAFQTTFVA